MNNPTNEMLTGILKEIAQLFTGHGHETEFDGWNVLRTNPTHSGAYIQIKQAVGNDFLIELLHKKRAADSYPERARQAIHTRVMMDLIHSARSLDAKYFLRHNLPSLKEIGIEQVVDSLIRLHQEFDRIWTQLVPICDSLVKVLERCDENVEAIMHSVDGVLDPTRPRPWYSKNYVPEPGDL
jgi:hypothetical protein